MATENFPWPGPVRQGQSGARFRWENQQRRVGDGPGDHLPSSAINPYIYREVQQ